MHCVHQESAIDPYDAREFSSSFEMVLQLTAGPFNWWHAIRQAWPERKIADPRTLLQRNVKHVYTSTANDNSLRAALVCRNLLK